jgi:ribonuclease P protein component
LTVTGKTGNAVERNRIKRRLRAAIGEVGRATAADGMDYVLIGRRDILATPYTTLLAELSAGLNRLSSDAGRNTSSSSLPTQKNR